MTTLNLRVIYPAVAYFRGGRGLSSIEKVSVCLENALMHGLPHKWPIHVVYSPRLRTVHMRTSIPERVGDTNEAWLCILVCSCFRHDDRLVPDLFSAHCPCSSRGLSYVVATRKSLAKSLGRNGDLYCWSILLLNEVVHVIVRVAVVPRTSHGCMHASDCFSDKRNVADDLIVYNWHCLALPLFVNAKEIERKASGELRPPPIGNASVGTFCISR